LLLAATSSSFTTIQDLTTRTGRLKRISPKQEPLILSNRAGRIPAHPQENETTMAKKATPAPMKAAPKKGAAVPAKKGAAAPMKKGC
jgi:hypothetical protein